MTGTRARRNAKANSSLSRNWRHLSHVFDPSVAPWMSPDGTLECCSIGLCYGLYTDFCSSSNKNGFPDRGTRFHYKDSIHHPMKNVKQKKRKKNHAVNKVLFEPATREPFSLLITAIGL
jgi:hypothetical protein